MLKPIPSDARMELMALHDTLGTSRFIEAVWDMRHRGDHRPSSKIGWPIQRTPGVVINTWPHMGAEIPAHTLTRIERQYAAVADLDSWRAK
jgi:hypothetical protein